MQYSTVVSSTFFCIQVKREYYTTVLYVAKSDVIDFLQHK